LTPVLASTSASADFIPSPKTTAEQPHATLGYGCQPFRVLQKAELHAEACTLLATTLLKRFVSNFIYSSQKNCGRAVRNATLTVLVAPGLSDRLLRATNSMQGVEEVPKLWPSGRPEGQGVENVSPCSVAWSVAGRRSLRQVRRWACFVHRSMPPGREGCSYCRHRFLACFDPHSVSQGTKSLFTSL